jgi:predicted DNA-binding transcriptional regulator AlpA
MGVTQKMEAQKLVDDTEASAILGVARQTLRNWRNLRKGPRYIKIGARIVRYNVDDLREFIRKQTIEID